jgi:hypothetical protein
VSEGEAKNQWRASAGENMLMMRRFNGEIKLVKWRFWINFPSLSQPCNRKAKHSNN